jgi:hypothetical protein
MIPAGGWAMTRKTDVLFLACCAGWLVCLPLLTVLGGIWLFCYAVVSLLADRFSSAAPVPSDAREAAQRLCFGNDVRHLP